MNSIVFAIAMIGCLIGIALGAHLGDSLMLGTGIAAAALLIVLCVLEGRWPERIRIQHLRWRARHLQYVIEKTTDEMTNEWFHDPGSDHWHSLDAWLAELHMDRIALRHRIEDLTYKLGREKY
jgi:hypothetical protein